MNKFLFMKKNLKVLSGTGYPKISYYAFHFPKLCRLWEIVNSKGKLNSNHSSLFFYQLLKKYWLFLGDSCVYYPFFKILVYASKAFTFCKTMKPQQTSSCNEHDKLLVIALGKSLQSSHAEGTWKCTRHVSLDC